jgi:hypothetical protein
VIKVGDLVKFKGEDLNDPDNGKGIVVEIKNPSQIKPDKKMDKYLKTNYFSRPSLIIRIFRRLFP